MVNTTNFTKDNKVGEIAETMVLSMIKKKYPKAFKVSGNFEPYDIYVPEKGIKVEVKYDVRSHETGNVFIETLFNGKPSGIKTSEADVWVIYDGFYRYWVATETLRWLLPQGEKITTRISGNLLQGVLLKVPLLELWTPN